MKRTPIFTQPRRFVPQLWVAPAAAAIALALTPDAAFAHAPRSIEAFQSQPTIAVPQSVADVHPVLEQHSRRGGGGGGGGGQAVPRGGGSSGGSTRSGGSSTPATGGSSGGSSGGSARTRSGSGASGGSTSRADGSTGTPTYSRPRDGQTSTGTAVERGAPSDGGERVRTVVGGGYYGGFYPWGWGGLGLGGYYGYSDPWGGWYDPYPVSGYDYDGSLKLKVSPRQAEVYVDGYFAGSVDDYDGLFQRLRLVPGPHRIEVRLDGYESLSFDVRIQPNRTVTYKGDMQKLESGADAID